MVKNRGRGCKNDDKIKNPESSQIRNDRHTTITINLT